MHDGQECAEKRHTAARSLDTEKVGHGFFFFYGVQYRIATICGIAVSETYIFIYTSICIVPIHHVYSDSSPKTNASTGPESLLD